MHHAHRPVPRSGRPQRGATVVEALIALLVLSVGLVALARLQSQMRLHADFARQRAEATRLAQADLEALRAFPVLGPAGPGAAPGFDDLVSRLAVVDTDAGRPLDARYDVDRELQSADGLRSAVLTVRWHDRTGQMQQVQFASLIARTPPALSGALAAQAPVAPGPAVPRLLGRSSRVPLAATPVAPGRSAWKPSLAGTVAWVFDDSTGEIVERCSVAPGPVALQASTLVGCATSNALLLSGLVRRSQAGEADPEQAQDAPLPLGVRVLLSGGPYPAEPECVAEAQQLVEIATPAGMRRIGVPMSATPVDWGVAAWTPLGDRFVAYHCAITPRLGAWSGRSIVEPQGWSLGTGAADWKVCRYSADHDGSGAVDQNVEHPEHYHHVDRALMQQNFLLVPGPMACPAVPAVPAAWSTVAHQP